MLESNQPKLAYETSKATMPTIRNMVLPNGLEPLLSDYKSLVLPLNYDSKRGELLWQRVHLARSSGLEPE